MRKTWVSVLQECSSKKRLPATFASTSHVGQSTTQPNLFSSPLTQRLQGAPLQFPATLGDPTMQETPELKGLHSDRPCTSSSRAQLAEITILVLHLWKLHQHPSAFSFPHSWGSFEKNRWGNYEYLLGLLCVPQYLTAPKGCKAAGCVLGGFPPVDNVTALSTPSSAPRLLNSFGHFFTPRTACTTVINSDFNHNAFFFESPMNSWFC